MRWTVLFCVVLGLVVISGCRDKKPEADVSKKGSEGRDKAVLALVGDEEITRADVEDLLERLPPRRREIMKQRALDDRIEMRVFANEATAAGLDQDAEVKKLLEKRRSLGLLSTSTLTRRRNPLKKPSRSTMTPIRISSWCRKASSSSRSWSGKRRKPRRYWLR
jgi:hypothetical protein